MEAVIFCGIQATGKSAFYKERFYRTHVRVNLDMLRTRHREDVLLRACFEAKQPVVIDNTNPTVEERARYIVMARAAQFRVIGYYFESKIEDALRRNARRPEVERVPERGLRGAHARLRLPSPQEGFDQLHYVRIDHSKGAPAAPADALRTPVDAAGTFVVQEWRDEV